jgi:SAM-dependent methyltransferase
MRNDSGSIIDPYYTSGQYLQNASGNADATFKIAELAKVVDEYRRQYGLHITKVADIGCGTGGTTLACAELFKQTGEEVQVDGYDVHPDVAHLRGTDRVQFFQTDFCTQVLQSPYDLALILDVLEHVPDPISFLKAVAERAYLVALHIPLDDSWLSGLRNLARSNLDNPGHLIQLNPASALNLVAFAGLRTRIYRYTPGFRAPTGRQTRQQRLLYPVRALLYRLTPYLLQRTVGGTSLMVLAETPLELKRRRQNRV